MSLSDTKSIRTALFVKIEIEEYFDKDTGLLAPETLLFSDHNHNYGLLSEDGSTVETYIALGNLMNVSSSVRSLKGTNDTLTIVLSGIPDQSRKEILLSKLKGGLVLIKRAFFDADTNQFIDDSTVPNPIVRYRGYITNWSLNETWDTRTRSSTNTIQFECGSWIDLLSTKPSFRKTNPVDMKRFYPTDVSFDRIYKIANSNYNFGKDQ